METTMRKIYWAAPLLLLAFLLVFAFGCTEKTGSGGGDSISVGAVQILLGTDTLRYLPGDSASTSVSVIVTSNEGTVMRGVKVDIALANASIGILEFVDTDLEDTTNAFGRVDMVYRSYARPGNNYISATAGGRSAIDSIVVQEANIVVSELLLTVDPPHVFASVAQPDTVTVSVTITDANGAGIQGVSIPISVSRGNYIPPQPTDASGSVQTQWMLRAPEGMAYVSAQAGALLATDSVRVSEVADESGTLSLTSSTNVGHADNCVTPILMTAILRDQDGVGVTGDTIKFAVHGFGYPDSTAVVTNTAGIATTRFCDLGVPSETDSVYVIAIHDEWALRDTVGIWITPALEITLVQLTLQNPVGTAGIDSVQMNMNVQYEDSTPVSGVAIHYETNCGTFTWQDTTLMNGNVQQNYYRFCNQTNLPQVQVWAVVAGIQSNIEIVFPQPGPARSIASIQYARNPIGIGDTTSVWALIVDTLNNPVFAGQAVVCSTSLGTVNPMIAQTDSTGRAYTVLNSGTTAGPANVRMHLVGLDVDSVIISVLSNLPSSISLTVDNPAPQVWGTGGNSSTTLRAMVRDANGNPVPDGTGVRFCILPTFPAGVNINGVGLCDSAFTSGGLAVATLNAGTVPGPVRVQACTRVETTDICATSDIINIVAGPPKNITIDPNSIGEDIGGGAWELEISAIVVDTFNNPVQCNTAVYFSVDPDTAQVTSDSVFVCNQNRNGDAYPGIAFNFLHFNSAATNEVVFITVRTGGAIPVTETIEFTLPIQEPVIELTIGHGASWHFPTDGDPCQIPCIARVTDGHGTPINNQRVNYYIQLGSLFRNCGGTGGETSFAWTGPFGDPPGQPVGESFLCLRELATNIFPDPVTPERTGEVAVEVHGFAAATDSRLILFRRGQGLTQRTIEGE